MTQSSHGRWLRGLGEGPGHRVPCPRRAPTASAELLAPAPGAPGDTARPQAQRPPAPRPRRLFPWPHKPGCGGPRGGSCRGRSELFPGSRAEDCAPAMGAVSQRGAHLCHPHPALPGRRAGGSATLRRGPPGLRAAAGRKGAWGVGIGAFQYPPNLIDAKCKSALSPTQATCSSHWRSFRVKNR